MKQQDRPWIYKNGVKVYQEEKYTQRNEDKTDYEMEQILADLHLGRAFDEDEYYRVKSKTEYIR